VLGHGLVHCLAAVDSVGILHLVVVAVGAAVAGVVVAAAVMVMAERMMMPALY
jgi:hypothetical protein